MNHNHNIQHYNQPHQQQHTPQMPQQLVQATQQHSIYCDNNGPYQFNQARQQRIVTQQAGTDAMHSSGIVGVRQQHENLSQQQQHQHQNGLIVAGDGCVNYGEGFSQINYLQSGAKQQVFNYEVNQPISQYHHLQSQEIDTANTYDNYNDVYLQQTQTDDGAPVVYQMQVQRYNVPSSTYGSQSSITYEPVAQQQQQQIRYITTTDPQIATNAAVADGYMIARQQHIQNLQVSQIGNNLGQYHPQAHYDQQIISQNVSTAEVPTRNQIMNQNNTFIRYQQQQQVQQHQVPNGIASNNLTYFNSNQLVMNESNQNYNYDSTGQGSSLDLMPEQHIDQVTADSSSLPSGPVGCDIVEAAEASQQFNEQHQYNAQPICSNQELHAAASQGQHDLPSTSSIEEVHPSQLQQQRSSLDKNSHETGNRFQQHQQQIYIEMRSCTSLSQDWLDNICRQLIEHMNHFGICVIDNFLGSLKGELILKEVQQLYSSGQYTKGRLVTNKFNAEAADAARAASAESKSSQTIPSNAATTSAPTLAAAGSTTTTATTPVTTTNPMAHQRDTTGTIRSDHVIWIDGCEDGCSEINNLIQTLCSVITNSSRLSLYSNNGLDKIVINKRTKAHVACYPANGTRYIKHVDNPNNDGRVITAIYYLNKNWDTKRDGGLLRMFPADMDEVANIEPLFDRVLFFWSDRRNPHEVLPAYRDRFAITVWYIGENRIQQL